MEETENNQYEVFRFVSTALSRALQACRPLGLLQTTDRIAVTVKRDHSTLGVRVSGIDSFHLALAFSNIIEVSGY